MSAVYFLYAEGKKARAFPEKHFVSGAGFKRSFWNLERVLQAEAGLLVEGELDVCALVEAGVPVTEILGAHGAKDKPIEGDPIEQPRLRLRRSGAAMAHRRHLPPQRAS